MPSTGVRASMLAVNIGKSTDRVPRLYASVIHRFAGLERRLIHA